MLGIVLAAAALLADFARNLSRLATHPAPKLAQNIEESIDVLSAALDKSKAVLRETEGRLDQSLARASSAEGALGGWGDTRDAMRRARENTVKVEMELKRIEDMLREERERYQDAVGKRKRGGGERSGLEGKIKERELEMEALRKKMEQLEKNEVKVREEKEKREEALGVEMKDRELELERVRLERVKAEEQAVGLEKRAADVSEQAEAAELALEETRRELQRMQKDLDEREKGREIMERESGEMEKKREELEELKGMMGDMEREVDDLKLELKSRDQIVNEVALESDELRSLLAARDAELKEVSTRLESAMLADVDSGGGDPEFSEMKLKEVKKNLDAEQLALSAEITKAQMASEDMSNQDVDLLGRLVKEMDAEGALMQAGLRKMESAVSIEESTGGRKNEAVDDVLESIEEALKRGDDMPVDEVLQRLSEAAEAEGQGMEMMMTDMEEERNADSVESEGGVVDLDIAEVNEEVLNRALGGGKKRWRKKKIVSETVGVAKQGEVTADMEEKKGRGRPKKKESEGKSDDGEGMKRKRGRPRKKPEV